MAGVFAVYVILSFSWFLAQNPHQVDFVRKSAPFEGSSTELKIVLVAWKKINNLVSLMPPPTESKIYANFPVISLCL